MKGKHLFLLLILVGGLAALWLRFSKNDQATWSPEGRVGSKILEFPVNDVVRLRIKGVGGELNLVKKDENWTVQERQSFPASFELVSRVLRKLWELKAVQEVRVGASQLPRLQLLEPDKGSDAGTLVTVFGTSDKELGSLLLGKAYMRKAEGGGDAGIPAGRYVKVVDKPAISLVSEVLDELKIDAQPWLMKEFLGLDSPRAITVSGAHQWAVSRENASAEWTLADLSGEEKMDSKKTSSFGGLFGSSPFVDVLALDAKAEAVTTVVVDTFDGFRCELKIGKEQAGNYPLFVQVTGAFAKERLSGPDEKPEDKTRLDAEFATKLKGLEEKLVKAKKLEAWGYVIPKFRIESFLQDRAGLLLPKPKEVAKPAGEASPVLEVPKPAVE